MEFWRHFFNDWGLVAAALAIILMEAVLIFQLALQLDKARSQWQLEPTTRYEISQPGTYKVTGADGQTTTVEGPAVIELKE